MMRSYFRRWLDRWTSRTRSPQDPARARRKARLHVEQLEKREVPTISISDAALVTEGHAGVVNATFTVSLSAPSVVPVTVDFATANGSARAIRVQRVAGAGTTDVVNRPVFVTSPPGDNNRLFIVEQHSGQIRILNRTTGAINATPFITVPGLNTGNEQGLLSLAFHPNYEANGFFYVNFTTNTAPPGVTPGAAGVTIVRRYQVSAGNPDVADPASATNVLVFAQPQSNHNGGWMGFGPDGFLYISSGDGGGANDTGAGHTPGIGNGQDPSDGNFLGKILRLDVNSDAFPADPNRHYAIPSTNPFAGPDGREDAIWAWGLRNPWRPSFDRQTGDLYIGDVGQNTIEEIDVQPAGVIGGQNYEWRLREGTIQTPAAGIGGARPAGGIQPIYDFGHGGGVRQGNSVAGGYVYRGPIPELRGQYFFGDSINTRVWSLRWDGSDQIMHNGTNFTDFTDWLTTGINRLPTDAGSIANISSFGEDNQGNLYIISLFSGPSGAIHQIVDGADYLPNSGTLTFNPGVTSLNVTVQILGDRLDEPLENFFVNLSNATGGETILDGQGEGRINDDDGLTTLQVVDRRMTHTGFQVDFNWPIDPTTLNLYDSQAAMLGPPDITVTPSPGGTPLVGSVALSNDGTRLTFIATDGVLMPGVYNVFMRSAANGIRAQANGELLDGNGDGNPGGDHMSTESLALTPGSTAVISVPNFTRGPGQVVNVPAGAPGIPGIPVSISESLGVTEVQLTLTWNPQLLHISGAVPAPGLPGTSFTYTPLRPGMGRFVYTNPTPTTMGPLTFGFLTADVPLFGGDVYRSKHILDLSGLLINGGVTSGIEDDGLHVAAYFGDATGNGDYSSADATLALRVALGLDTGFGTYQQADPRILADINNNGMLNSADATAILQEVVGIDRTEIPPRPAGAPVIPPGGPDPLLQVLAGQTAGPGQLVKVPIALDLSDGLQSVDLALSYDTSRLELVPGGVRLGSLTGDFDLFLTNHDPQAGTLRVGMGRALALTGKGSGTVLELEFRVKADAPAGPAIVNLNERVLTSQTRLNEGNLVLNPAPSDEAGDVLDGIIKVVSAPTTTVTNVIINDGAAQRSQVTSVTVNFGSSVRFLSDPKSAFKVTGGRIGEVGLNVAVLPTGPTSVRITFTGPGITNGSLPDGLFKLSIDGNQIVDNSGNKVDAEGDGKAGGFSSVAFFRLFGDGDGDGDVDRTDLKQLLSTMGRRNAPFGFLSLFDIDGNGRVTAFDLRQFRNRMGKTVAQLK